MPKKKSKKNPLTQEDKKITGNFPAIEFSMKMLLAISSDSKSYPTARETGVKGSHCVSI